MFVFKMKLIVICVFLSCLDWINGQEELIAGHVLFRHGDRTPLSTFPSDPFQEKDWPNGFGQLTILGIEQQHRLGQIIREHYEYLLSEDYIAREIYVRSTDVDRTLMSAQANLVGLYPMPKITIDGIPIQPVPIHTEPTDVDFLLGQNNCSRYNQVVGDIEQSDEVQTKNTQYAEFFRYLGTCTNQSNLDVFSAWDVADTIFVEHIYNRTPSWAFDASIQGNLSEINEFAFRVLFSNNDTQRLRGGPVIQDIWYNMNNLTVGHSYKKLKLYSAHDTTMSAALAFLRMNYPHQPKYASALFIDLYQKDTGYFVQVEYLNDTNANGTDVYQLEGCFSTLCPFINFTSVFKPRFPGNVDVECRRKYPPSPIPLDHSGKLITATVITIVTLVVMIFVIFFCVFIRKNESKPFSVEDEQTSVFA